jgi:hypothetical protein
VEKYCTAGQATDDIIVRRMRIACWIPKTTKTHSEFVIFIVFPLQKYAYIAYLVRFLTTMNIEITVLMDVTPGTLV